MNFQEPINVMGTMLLIGILWSHLHLAKVNELLDRPLTELRISRKEHQARIRAAIIWRVTPIIIITGAIAIMYSAEVINIIWVGTGANNDEKIKDVFFLWIYGMSAATLFYWSMKMRRILRME